MSAALRADLDRPLYLQLVDALRREIAGRRPGERIDSEPALAERFGVSRFTVTRAVEMLVDEGLIRRRQGLGSFVAPPPLRRQPSYLASFTEAVEAQGRVATHRLIAFGATEWREDLPYDPGDRLVEARPAAARRRHTDRAARLGAAGRSGQPHRPDAKARRGAEILALPPVRRSGPRRRARAWRRCARGRRFLRRRGFWSLATTPS